MKRRHLYITTYVLSFLFLLLAGCSWRVPLSNRLSAVERTQYTEVEQCCRSHGAQMWSSYLHSLPGT